ncbi:glycosyltransferase involved in cell wall biosynthesis [Elusimicrobium posterum]|uniref:glycosyltransferase n=1 Tax=Elusimicrobium posterum TaxID=3116653 RepID=UPI003C709F70
MNIAIVIPTLSMGGAEKMALYQAGEFVKRGHDVTLLTTHDAPDFYTHAPEIKRIKLNFPVKKSFIDFLFAPKRIRLLAKTLKEINPDAAIIHMNPPAGVAAKMADIPYIFAEHSHLPDTHINYFKKLVFEDAKCVVVLTDKDKKYVKKLLPKVKTSIIYNPAVKPPLEKDEKPAFFGPQRNIVAIGRLVEQKGFDMLIRAWAQIEDKFPHWQLNIIGKGEEQKKLQRLIEEFKLKNIKLPGAMQSPAAAFKYADLFVVSSRWEGFNLALCEAMSYNNAVVSFDCTGPDVIIRDGVDGFLVSQGSVTGLAEMMAILMENDAKREAFAAAAPDVLNRFTMDAYIDAYEKLLK